MRLTSLFLLSLAACGADTFRGETDSASHLAVPPDAPGGDSRGVGDAWSEPEVKDGATSQDASQAQDAGVPDQGAPDAWDSSTGWDGSCAGCRWEPGAGQCGQLSCDFVCPLSCSDPPPTLTQGPSGCTDYSTDGGELLFCCPKNNPGCK